MRGVLEGEAKNEGEVRGWPASRAGANERGDRIERESEIFCTGYDEMRDFEMGRTRINNRQQTPIPLPPLLPPIPTSLLHPLKAIFIPLDPPSFPALQFRPEREVERGNKEDPVETLCVLFRELERWVGGRGGGE